MHFVSIPNDNSSGLYKAEERKEILTEGSSESCPLEENRGVATAASRPLSPGAAPAVARLPVHVLRMDCAYPPKTLLPSSSQAASRWATHPGRVVGRRKFSVALRAVLVVAIHRTNT